MANTHKPDRIWLGYLLVAIVFGLGSITAHCQSPGSLIWLPSSGSGLRGEFLFQTQAPTVIVVINKELNGGDACYMAIEGLQGPRPVAYVYNDLTGDWIGDGVNCRVVVWKEGEWTRLAIEYSNKWKGRKTVYIMERGITGDVGLWYRAGLWEVKEEPVPELPPTVPAMPAFLLDFFPSKPTPTPIPPITLTPMPVK